MSILIGDCRQALATLPEKSVHLVVTSPPYWGLRDYGNDGQIGLERTPEAYIASMLDVFRAVRRVLRDDGVCWLNLGDSYLSAPAGNKSPSGISQNSAKRLAGSLSDYNATKKSGPGLKPGDLVGIPWRVALALQADGWYLRSDVIWAKRNTMPESVAGWRWEKCRMKVRSLRQQTQKHHAATLSPGRDNYTSAGLAGEPSAEWAPCPGCPKCSATDGYVLRRGSWRPTKAHEMVFMLAKSERYFADGEGVRERAEMKPQRRLTAQPRRQGQHAVDAWAQPRILRDEVTTDGNPAGRNLRDVWTLSSTPSKLRHFAMMPPALVEKCILSGPEKVCGAMLRKLRLRSDLTPEQMARAEVFLRRKGLL